VIFDYCSASDLACHLEFCWLLTQYRDGLE
jgi:hypothetical protein